MYWRELLANYTIIDYSHYYDLNFKSHGVIVLLAPSVLSNVSLDLSVAGRTASGGFNHEPHTLTQRRERETHTYTSKNSLGWIQLHTARERETQRAWKVERKQWQTMRLQANEEDWGRNSSVYDTLSTLSITSTCVLYYSTPLLQSVEPLRPLE